MKASVYYGVQFAQSRMLLASQAGARSELPRLLAPGADVSIDGAAPAEGWATHLPATQYIEPADEDGNVRASWTTLGAELTGDEATGGIRYVVGEYDNLFTRHDGVWKFTRLRWRPVARTTPWPQRPDAVLERHRADPSAWAQLPPAPGAVSDAGVSPHTLVTLELRNTVMGICHRYNQSGVSALEDPRVRPAAARSAREMLAADGAGRGFVLATSPVVGIAADALSARVFVSATFLAPRGADRIEHRRGSLLVSFTRATASGPWIIAAWDWYRYATLQPWTLDDVSGFRERNDDE